MGNVSKFREVRSKLNSRSIRALARSLPWPYNGMLNDILGAIQSGGNYLAALGLASYTEVCGRQIFFNGDNKVKDWKCFNRFIHFMGAGEALKKKLQFEGKKILFKDAVRNGLVHRYFMKVGSRSNVFVQCGGKEDWILNQGAKPGCIGGDSVLCSVLCCPETGKRTRIA